MIPALMAARPLIKYGVIVGLPLLLLTASHWYAWSKGDTNGEKRILAQWDAANAKVMKESNKQLIDVREMEARLADEKAKDAQIIAKQKAELKRKAEEYAKSKPPMVLSLRFAQLWDELISVPNAAGKSLSTADPRSGGIQVSSGEVRAAAAPLVPIPQEDGTVVELTTDELQQAVIHTHDVLAECKGDYNQFSVWNDGRERIELKRLAQ